MSLISFEISGDWAVGRVAWRPRCWWGDAGVYPMTGKRRKGFNTEGTEEREHPDRVGVNAVRGEEGGVKPPLHEGN